jgi:hypothetical protein
VLASLINRCTQGCLSDAFQSSLYASTSKPYRNRLILNKIYLEYIVTVGGIIMGCMPPSMNA